MSRSEPPQEHHLVGETVGGEYRVVALLGRGGFGEVLRARRLGADGFAKDVALKLLHSSMNATPDVVNRLKDEARFLGLLSHPAIVKVDLLTRIQERWAVVMEFVEGVSLEVLLQNYGPLPPGVVVHIGAEVAAALDYAYNHPVSQPGGVRQPLHLLHRDIKPANLQITPHGEVKVLDFGIAKAELDSREAVTGTDDVLMTKGYAAPERLRGVEHPAGDVFSLGAVLVELLTGEQLNLIGPILKAVLEGEPIDARSVVQERLDQLDARLARVHGLPATTRALLLQTFAWDHNARPTARTLAKELRAQQAALGHDFLEFCDHVVEPMARGEALPPRNVPLDTAAAPDASSPMDTSIGVVLRDPPPKPPARSRARVVGPMARGEALPPRNVPLDTSAAPDASPMDTSIGAVLRDPPPKLPARSGARVVGAVVAGLMVGGFALMLGPTLWSNAPLDLDDEALPLDGLAPLPEGVANLSPDQMAVPSSAPIEIAPTRYLTTEPESLWANDPTESVNFGEGADNHTTMDEQKSQTMEAKPQATEEQKSQPTVKQESPAQPKKSERSTTKLPSAKSTQPKPAEVQLSGDLSSVWLYDTGMRGTRISTWSTTEFAPGKYVIYADIGRGQPEPLGQYVPLGAGESVTLECNDLNDTCSIRRGTTQN